MIIRATEVETNIIKTAIMAYTSDNTEKKETLK